MKYTEAAATLLLMGGVVSSSTLLPPPSSTISTTCPDSSFGVTSSKLLNVKGGGLFPNGERGDPKALAKKSSKQPTSSTGRAWGKGLNNVGEAKMGYTSGKRGVWMNMDLDVNKLTNSLGEAGKPVAVLLYLIQRGVFYAAPILAAASLYKQAKGNNGKSQAAYPFQVGLPQETPAARALAFGSIDASEQRRRSHRPSTPRSSDASVKPWPAGGAYQPSLAALDFKSFFNLVLRGLLQFGSLTGIAYALGYWVEYESGCAGLLADKRVRRALDILGPFLAIFFSDKIGFLRSKMDMSWYHRVLRKPSWTPPPIAFPLVWVPLKILQTAALYLVWETVDHNALSPAILFFLAHLALGDLWNLTFFQERRIGFGLVVMYAFYGALGLSAYSFYQINPLAGYLLIPTAGWVFIASALNFSIWLLNGQESLFPVKSA